MDIKDIIKMYGTTADYYDHCTGRIYKLSKMSYNAEKNETSIPVNLDGDIIGDIKIAGDARQLSD